MTRGEGSLAPAGEHSDIHVSSTQLAGGRLELVGKLGEGGFGEVFEAVDHDNGTRVALKVLRRAGPDALLRFKSEFRSVADLHHPNLVRLGELFEDDGLWFFTMEKVQGVGFLEYVRPDEEGVDEARLRSALKQLATGLCALHAAGKLHRDIKPSNVIVDVAGRVVLLDLGLVRDTTTRESMELGPVGTVAYMSPEQAGTQPQAAASDCYAVGAMLFEALTGRFPFVGGSVEVLLAKQQSDAPSVREFAPDTPEDLVVLCDELLRRDPALRPRAQDILDRIEAPSLVVDTMGPTRTATGTRGPRAFVGRERELTLLERALEPIEHDELSVVLLEGESGIGKSQLASEWRAHIEQRPHMVVLQGRCYERETVPFKALDGIVDALGRYLRHLDDHSCRALMPRHVGPLLRVFPTLSRVATLVEAAVRTETHVDQLALRAAGFLALREMLQRLAERHRVVLCIDDLHWADAESLSLLEELLRPPDPPGLLLIGTSRTSEEREPEVDRALQNLLKISPHSECITLSGLAHDDAVALAEALLPPALRGQANAIAERSEGQPIFIEALSAHAELAGEDEPPDLDDAILFALADLSDAARKVLRVTAVAGVPVEVRALGEAAQVPAESVGPAVAQLRTQRLVRVRKGRNERVGIGHDRVREALVSHLDRRERRHLHSRLARSLSARNADPESLFFHYREAGETRDAAAAARRAAELATEALAFDKAARMYTASLELDPEQYGRETLIENLAESLFNAGRAEEAAGAFLRASDANPTRELELRRRAAESMLQCGRVEDGMELASEVLERLGVRIAGSTRAALLSGLWQSMKASFARSSFEVRDITTVPQDELTRIDMTLAMAPALGPIDQMKGFELASRANALALSAGEPGRAAVAIASRMWGLYFSGRHGAIRSNLKFARELADTSDEPRVDAQVRFFEAMMYGLMDGDARAALKNLAEVERTLSERCTGVDWLLAAARQATLSWQIQAGHSTDLSHQYPRVMRQAKERGHTYGVSQLALSAGWYEALLRDRPDDARERLDRALTAWPRSTTGPEGLLLLMSRLAIGVYERDQEGIDEALLQWGPLERLMRRGLTTPTLWSLRACAATVLADVRPEAKDAHERDAATAAKGLARIKLPDSMVAPRLALVRGCLAARNGAIDAAAELLKSSQREFERSSAEVMHGAASLRLAELRKDRSGLDAARNLLRRAGAAEPDRFVTLLAPRIAPLA